MLEFTQAAQFATHIRSVDRQQHRIGFVPTMGALHEGHFSLVRRSIEECDQTIVSIFVNPTQFNNSSDLANYPKQLDADRKALADLGCDLLFCPSAEDMYPSKPAISLHFGSMEEVLEGAHRPGHFQGVGLIVSKLFHIIQPDRAYFGLKDLQQFILIQRLVSDLNFPLEVIGCPTIRETSGLALSSRNQRLSIHGKEIAANLYKGLERAELELSTAPPQETIGKLRHYYNRVDGLELEYAEWVLISDLTPVENVMPSVPSAICVAAYVEGIRLIDNLYLR